MKNKIKIEIFYEKLEKAKRIVFGNDYKNLFENLFVCGVLNEIGITDNYFT